MKTFCNPMPRFASLQVYKTDDEGKTTYFIGLTNYAQTRQKDDLIYTNIAPEGGQRYYRAVGSSSAVRRLAEEFGALESEANAENQRGTAHHNHHLLAHLWNLIPGVPKAKVSDDTPYDTRGIDQFLARHPNLRDELVDAIETMTPFGKSGSGFTPAEADSFKQQATQALKTANQDEHSVWFAT